MDLEEQFVIQNWQMIRLFLFVACAFAVSMIFTPLLTHFLYKYKFWKKQRRKAITGERAIVYERLHQKKHKKNVPTMAGVLIWLTVLVITLAANFSRSQTWLPLFTLITVGILGLVDDIVNVKISDGQAGISWKQKIIWLLLFATLGALWFYFKLEINSIHLPGIGDFIIGYWYIPLFILVILSTANSVNITDGLDGLAGGLLSFAFGAYALIAFLGGQYGIAYFCGTIVGAVLAYTWFNIYPARFFMGDTGSLALGATLGVVAMLTNSVLPLIIIGFVFVIETGSVLVQIFWKKVIGRKLFLSTPIHHHFEALGWPETKVTMRLWVIGAVMAAIGLAVALLGRGIG